jgi:ATP synthase regulation protein NCA2
VNARQDFVNSKASLQRMLESFEKDVALKDKKFNANEATTSLDVLMRHYERELEAPLRNAVTGTLPRSLLIQARPPCLKYSLACQGQACTLQQPATTCVLAHARRCTR